MDALILVDLQNDFMPGGALAIAGGDSVVPLANHLATAFELTVATQDWHPGRHGSFVGVHPSASVGDMIELCGTQQIVWPVHCVQGTQGAQFHTDLNQSAIAKVFQKGMDPSVDSYSGFFDNDERTSTGLDVFLRSKGVTRVFICGLATDYCVKFTALDSARLGFETFLIEDACRGVNLNPGDVDAAIEDMKSAGVFIVCASTLLVGGHKGDQ